ncbi:MAG: alpha/beta hydrolase [Pseudomonadota bacterium]
MPQYPTPKDGRAVALTMADGAVLRAGFFPALKAPQRGVVALLPGRVEFIEKYFEVVEELRARGFAVGVLDWRGQGLSTRLLADGVKGHIDDFQTYVDDLRVFLHAVAREFPGGPLLVLAHSMGGAVALKLMTEGYDGADGVILSAPMTRLIQNPLKRWAAQILSRGACMFGAGEALAPAEGVRADEPFPDHTLTHDRERGERFYALKLASPDAVVGRPTYRWLDTAFAATQVFSDPQRLGDVKPPVLIVSPRDERLVDPASHDRIVCDLPDGRLVRIPGARHEILMEEDRYRDVFWEAFDAFVENVFGPAPPVQPEAPKSV